MTLDEQKRIMRAESEIETITEIIEIFESSDCTTFVEAIQILHEMYETHYAKMIHLHEIQDTKV